MIVYYKGEPAEGTDIFGACGIFRKRDLVVDMKTVRDENDNESKLRKIVYNLPFNKHLPSDSDLDDMFNEMVSKCDLNIKYIIGLEDSGREYRGIMKNSE